MYWSLSTSHGIHLQTHSYAAATADLHQDTQLQSRTAGRHRLSRGSGDSETDYSESSAGAGYCNAASEYDDGGTSKTCPAVPPEAAGTGG